MKSIKNISILQNKWLKIFLFGVACTFAASAANSAVMQVTPVRVDFDADRQAQSITVLNNGQNNLKAQVRVMEWSQTNGEDQLVPAKDLVPSPAIMDIAPDKHQTVRLVRTNANPPSKQLSYRILLDELPQLDMAPERAGVEILLRYSIPLFVNPPKPADASAVTKKASDPTDLSNTNIQVVRGANDMAELQITNNSTQALRVSGLTVRQADGKQKTLQDGLVGYALAGKQMSWPIGVKYPLATNAVLEARFNDDMNSQVIPLAGAAN